MEELEQFGARIFYWPNGDILVKQTERKNCIFRCTGQQYVIEPGSDQGTRLLDCLSLARLGKLEETKKPDHHAPVPGNNDQA